MDHAHETSKAKIVAYAAIIALLVGIGAAGVVPLPFMFFASALIGVALFHMRNFEVAIAGMAIIVLHAVLFRGVQLGEHMHDEAKGLINLAGLLTGFAVMAKLVEESEFGKLLPRFLPDDWKGAAVLLACVFVISQVLDNIAGALIGGVLAKQLFRGKVTIGFVAAIVAASNAGGAHSVLGDTTTTMMWIAGVGALDVLRGSIASVTALVVFALIAARAQDKVQRIQKDPTTNLVVRWWNLGGVLAALLGAVAANFLLGLPAAGVWVGLFVGWPLVMRTGHMPWREALAAAKGTIFILSLVMSASLMPVKELPPASVTSTFALGVVSAFFDNIPLTALAIKQGGYDWALLAFAVGFGGSMCWFGSSAGVAICNEFPEAKNLWAWMKGGWFVIVAYVAAFAVYVLLSSLPASTPLLVGVVSLVLLHAVVIYTMMTQKEAPPTLPFPQDRRSPDPPQVRERVMSEGEHPLESSITPPDLMVEEIVKQDDPKFHVTG